MTDAERAARVRLTVLATATAGVLLLVAGSTLLWFFRSSQVAAADDVARGRVAAIAARAEAGTLPDELTDVGEDGFGQVVTDGRVVAASGSLGAAPAVTDWRPPPGGSGVVELDGVPDDDETEDYRVWARRSADGATTVYVGTALESVAEAVRTLATTLALGLPLLLGAAAALLWLLTGRALRPVAEAHARQREFVADAAHELQSPLASYRSQLEVALAARAPDWPATARDLLGESDRMERLVRDLLFLARQEAAPRPQVPVDLDDVVLEEVARVRTTTATAVDARGVSAAPVRGDRADLSRMVRNLLANAVRHAASAVTVACHLERDRVVLEVADDGPGIPEVDRGEVFGRFHRGDAARSHDGGTGLGLAIVAAVVERHGGTVEVDDARPGAVLRVRLPSS